MNNMDMGTVVALIKGLAPKADPATIEKAVTDWLDDHPEATTTVEDGSITEEKLAADVALILSNLESDVTDAKNAIQGVDDIDNLLIGELPGTTQTVTFDANDNPSTITHSKNGTTVRTDVFTWGTDTVTEVRTAYGKSITITTDLTTLQSVISEVQEVA